MKKLLIALSVLATTQMALATATPITKIKDIYVYQKAVVLKMENKHTNPDECSHSKATEYLIVETDSEGGNRLYSALLSAYVAGKKVRLGFRDCKNWSDSETIPKVYGLSLLK